MEFVRKREKVSKAPLRPTWQMVSVSFLFVGLPVAALVTSIVSTKPELISHSHPPLLRGNKLVVPESSIMFEGTRRLELPPPTFIATQSPEFFNKQYTRENVLDDVDHRVGTDFAIPSELRNRVGFWFDAYTKYSSTSQVIHHARFPWLVFEVVETAHFFHEPRAQWMNQQAADKYVSRQKKMIHHALLNLASKKVPESGELTVLDQTLLSVIKTLPGNLRSNLRSAAHEIRVQTGQKDFFHHGLIRSVSYLSTMDKIFTDHGLPPDLTRLPFVESSFNTKAISKVGASGIWQFMPSIGRKFLHISSTIDERNSPLKATAAAAKLLKQNYQILGSWELALTAYNHGPGGVLRGVKRAKSKSLATLIDRYSSPSFGFASKNFYCSFLAALYAQKYHQEIFGDVPSHYAQEIQSHRLEKSFRARELAEEFGVELDILQDLNYDLKRAFQLNTTLPLGLQIFVPESKASGDRAS